jgi:hypothetical protein
VTQYQTNVDVEIESILGHVLNLRHVLELSIKSSKESTEPVSLLKTGNKVVEVG